jgi:hypothetical protein
MDNEKFPKERTPEETLKEAMNDLDEANFKFACFVSNFKRYVEKSERRIK